MNRNKIIGSINEIKVKLAFIELGYNVSTPYGDCERYDFIVDIKGRLVRVQVKSATPYDDGDAFAIDFRSIHYDTKGNKTSRTYSASEIDYFATCFKDKVYLLPIAECNSKKKLRLKPARYRPQRHVNWAKDYEIDKIIKEILADSEHENTKSHNCIEHENTKGRDEV